jgi:hypothetical protein
MFMTDLRKKSTSSWYWKRTNTWNYIWVILFFFHCLQMGRTTCLNQRFFIYDLILIALPYKTLFQILVFGTATNYLIP